MLLLRAGAEIFFFTSLDLAIYLIRIFWIFTGGSEWLISSRVKIVKPASRNVVNTKSWEVTRDRALQGKPFIKGAEPEEVSATQTSCNISGSPPEAAWISSSNVRAAAAAAVAVDWTVATLIIIIILAARKNKINHNPVCLQKSQVYTHVCMSIVE